MFDNSSNFLTGQQCDVVQYFTVAVPMQPGDVLLFNDLTFHRSLENHSERVRWSLDIRYSDAGNADLQARESCSPLRGNGYICHRPDGLVGRYQDWYASYQYEGEF